jgi:creatinine amidohydrolase
LLLSNGDARIGEESEHGERTVTLPKRDWMEMTWQEIAGAETGRWIAVLPLAAVEQHGPHLPLGVDTFIAEAYLARARDMLLDDLPVTFLPVQRFGVSAEHLAYPGTLTISAATAIALWTELGDSLARAGLRKLVLVTSHGGNVAAMELVARDLRARLGMLAVTVGWHRFGYPDGAFSPDEKKHGVHGGDIETSLMLAAKPDTVRMAEAPKATPATVAMAREFKWLGAYRPAGFAWMTQDLHPSGAVGDATLATAEKGETALQRGAEAFVELLREIDRFDLSRLRDGPLDKP